jgi:hypothetical protein
MHYTEVITLHGLMSISAFVEAIKTNVVIPSLFDLRDKKHHSHYPQESHRLSSEKLIYGRLRPPPRETLIPPTRLNSTIPNKLPSD